MKKQILRILRRTCVVLLCLGVLAVGASGPSSITAIPTDAATAGIDTDHARPVCVRRSDQRAVRGSPAEELQPETLVTSSP